MILKNKKSGFTLLEVIIVIIIVGVLASLALPRLFNTIEFSRSTEALNAIGILKRAADRCVMAVEATTGTANAYGSCDTFDELGTDNPGSAASAVFTYAISTYASPNWRVTATRAGSGQAVGDTITFTYNTSTGATTRVGNAGGAYAGLK